jgi:Asp-tRNA(Asn)/Glu-tRNA(Gln) amidotransferase A subunit family amidase
MKKAGAEIIDVSADVDKALALLLPQLNPAYLSSPAPYLDRGYLPKLDPDYADAAKFPGFKVMADHNLDALVYPMKTIPASPIGARTAPAPAAAGYRPASGNVLSSQTGFPSIIMPAGFTTEVYDWVADPANSSRTILGNAVPARVPVGMEFLGVPFSEPLLLKLAAGYEMTARHRRAPAEFSEGR